MSCSAFLPLARDILLRFKTLHCAHVLMVYTYDALGQLIRANDPNDPTAGESGTTWLYTYDRGGNILSKSYHSYTTGTPGVAVDTILYSYTDSNWKDKLTAYDGQTITYDAIGNPLNDGRRRYEWQAGRQLKKVYVKADLKEGTKPGVDEQSGTVLKIAWSNGNLLDGEVTSTQASAIVTRCGVDVTEEYAASAFAWKRDSGNAGADATWNAAHAGKKAITLTETDLNGDVKITCTLTGNGPSYGSIAVDEDMDATHTRGTLDANDTFQIVNGELKVTTSRGNVYALEDGKVKGAGAKLNGSITAETKLFASQPEDMVEFSYDHNGLRTQKKVTKADVTVKTTDYTLHCKLVMHLTRGSDEMHFFYDAQSRPAMVEFNGALYSYVHNLQGDIVGILDNAGSLVVEYKYDAWGKPTLVRTLTTAYEALAELNPFRYRGYVYDEETELYYLRSRYYDCQRLYFLTFDPLFSRGSLFVYCGNNPVRRIDSCGQSWFGDAWNWISNIGDQIGDAIGDAGQWLEETAKDIGGWICDRATDLANWVSNAWDATKKWIGNAVEKVVQVFKDLGNKIEKTWNAFWDNITASGGVGLGLSFSLFAGPLGGIHITPLTQDVLHFEATNKQTKFGMSFNFLDFGVSILGLTASTGMSGFKQYGKEDYSVQLGTRGDVVFGIGLYGVIGGSLEIRLHSQFFEKLKEIWL